MSLLNPYLNKKARSIPARNAVRSGMSQNAPKAGAATNASKGDPANKKLAPPKGKVHRPKGRGVLVD